MRFRYDDGCPTYFAGHIEESRNSAGLRAPSAHRSVVLTRRARRGSGGGADVEYPVFVGGIRRCPPDGVGGPDGSLNYLEAIFDPVHEEHRAMVDWYGGPFDPTGFDEARVRLGMENMVRRRRGPLASHRSGSRRPKR